MKAGFLSYLPPGAVRSAPWLRAAALAGLAAIVLARPGRAETLTLADCLRETIEHNPQIIEQRLAIEQAAGARLEDRSRALPNFLISGLGGQQGEETPETLQIIARTNGKKTTLTEVNARPATLFLIGNEALYQPIFDAAIPASWRLGNVEVAAARSNFLVVATAELHAARTEYYAAFYQQEIGAVFGEVSKTLASNTQGVSQLFHSGLVGRQSQLAAQVQQANFEPNVVATAGALRTGITALLNTMGRPLGPGSEPADSVTLSGPWEDLPLSFDAASVTAQTRRRRPDLQAGRDLIRIYDENANIVRGGYYPLIKIYVNGTVLPENFVRTQRPNSVRPEDDTEQTEIRPGVQENWNIIDTGSVLGGVRQYRALRDLLGITLRHLEEDIPGELSQVSVQLASAAKKEELLEANVGTSADTLRMIESGVAHGTNSQLEFLDAQNGVLATRESLLAAKLQMSLAHADFDLITGGYLRFVPINQPAASK